MAVMNLLSRIPNNSSLEAQPERRIYAALGPIGVPYEA